MEIKNQQEEEEVLLKRYLEGDNRAFGPLYYRYRNLFFYYINKQHPTLPMHEKEDLSIEFLGRISGQLHKYDKEKSLFRTWMSKCITNFLNDYRNKKSTKERKITTSLSNSNENGENYELPITSNENPLQNVSYLNIIKLIRNKLGDQDWKIFELHFLQGYNQKETGKKLGLREDTMWSRIKLLRKKLDGIQNL